MDKLLLTDLDGTIRKPISKNTFIQNPTDQQIIPLSAAALAHYHRQKWTIVGITNQGGIASGHKSLESTLAEQQHTLKLVPEIEYILLCPDMDGKWCYWVDREEFGKEYRNDGINFRKPGKGMLIKAMYGLKRPYEVLYVGDRPEDEAAARAANIPFLWTTDWYFSCDLLP